MGQRVVIHVGCPKTGSTEIQDQLFTNAGILSRRHVLYPMSRHDEHFLAALDVIDLHWSGQAAIDRVGAWDRMVELIRESNQNVLISHELLARATPEQIQHVVESLKGVEIEVIITARDLGRVIPAEYQEHVKYRNTMTFRAFLDRLQQPDVDDQPGVWARLTWLVQDVPALARRWADAIGEDHVTIVTVPGRGTPRDELLKRFAKAVGFDTGGFQPGQGKSNRSLGAAEVEVLRRFNEKRAESVDEPSYQLFARDRLIRRLDSREVTPPALSLTQRDYPWVRDVAQRWVDDLRAADYRVIGDLDELLPLEPPADAEDPDQITSERLFETALNFLGGSVTDYGTLDAEVVELRARNGELDWQVAHPIEVRKQVIVGRMEQSETGRSVLNVWRKRPGYSGD